MGTKWTSVTDRKQLWRYLMGDAHGENSVVLGDQFIAFLTHQDKWISSPPGGFNLANDQVSLGQRERFLIEEAGEGLWSFRSLHGYYWTAEPFGMFVQVNRKKVGDWERFTLYVNDAEDHLAIKSFHGKYLSALPGGVIRINRDEIHDSEQLLGWKKGDPDHWTPADKFDLVGTFDNRTSDGEGSLGYQRSIGTSVGKSEELTRTGSVGLGIQGVQAVVASMTSSIGFSWSSASSDTFSEQVTVSASITVPPRRSIRLYQAVAIYGPFTIRPSFFKTEEDE